VKGLGDPAHVALVALATAPTLQGEEQLDYGTDHIPTQEELRRQQHHQQQGIPGKGSGQQGGDMLFARAQP